MADIRQQIISLLAEPGGWDREYHYGFEMYGARGEFIGTVASVHKESVRFNNVRRTDEHFARQGERYFRYEDIEWIRPKNQTPSFYPMVIAVDFDGTIVRNKWPDIGEEILGAADAIRMWHAQGHRVIIWTCRAGNELEMCRVWLAKNFIPCYSINTNPPDRIGLYGSDTRKISADLYIDDKAVGAPDDPAELWRLACEKVSKMEREEATTCTSQPKANY